MITPFQVKVSMVDREDFSLIFHGQAMMAGFKLVFVFDPNSIEKGGTATWNWSKELSQIDAPGGSIGSEMIVNSITDSAKKYMTIARLEQILPTDQFEPIVGFLVANELTGDWGAD